MLEWKVDDKNNYSPYMINEAGSEIDVTWAPQAGSQAAYLSSPIFETLYAGERGPGKTDALLMDFAQHVGVGFEAEWRGIIFRRTVPELKDIIAKSRKWFPRIFPKATFNMNDKEWRFKDGETLRFAHFLNETDYDDYHGHAYPFIGWEELTNYPDPSCYLIMQSCCRSSYAGLPRKYRATTNPFGAGHMWIKRRWKLPYERGTLAGPIMRDMPTPEVPEPKPRIAILGKLEENKILLHAEPNYRANIVAAAGGNPARLRAWLYGDWSVVAGGMFADNWDERIHVLPPFPFHMIPRGWSIYRAYDHGQSKPFSVGWYAVSNGEPIQYGDFEIGSIRNDVIRIAEWYGCGKEHNSGLNMLTKRIAEGILDREEDWGIRDRVKAGPADSQIFARTEGEKSVAKDFASFGVKWEKSTKGKDSRVMGWQLVNSFLAGAVPNKDGYRELPGLFVTTRCTKFLELFPTTGRDVKNTDDIPTESEDHLQDEVRYMIYTNFRSKVVKTQRGFGGRRR